MANPMKNGFTTFLTGVFNLIPIRFLEYMVVLAIMSYPYFWMMASRSFQVVANFTFICYNPVSTNLAYVEFANNLYRFFFIVVLDFARFSLNIFTYSNMNGAYLN